MKFRIALILSAVSLNAQLVSAQSVSIQKIRSFGNACPANSVQAIVSPDGSALSILYSQFHADVGGPLLGATHMDCEIQIEMSKPVEVTPQLKSVDMRGFVSLDAGMGAQEWSEFELDFGRASHEFARTQFRGPISQTYILSARRPGASQQLPRCNSSPLAHMRINSHFRVEGGSPERVGTLSVDSLDSLMVHTYHLDWQPCANQRKFH
jgi:hypothetical protein